MNGLQKTIIENRPPKKRGGFRFGAGRPRLDEPKLQVLLHLPPDVHKALSKAAECAETSMSRYTERALIAALAKDKNRKRRKYAKRTTRPEP
jgi:hypothetical protein